MFAFEGFFLGLLALAGTCTAAFDPSPVASNVTIVAQGKDVNSTGGEGHVAAEGSLSPFGQICVGCGVNWHDGNGFGGAIDARSKDFGLGGGWKIEEGTISMEAGIGFSASNATAELEFKAKRDGKFEFKLTFPGQFFCEPNGFVNGTYSMECTSV